MTPEKSPLAMDVTSRNAAHITDLQASNSALVEENRRLKAELAAAKSSHFDAANSRVAEYHQLKEAYAVLEGERDSLRDDNHILTTVRDGWQQKFCALQAELAAAKEALRSYEQFEAALVLDSGSWVGQTGHPFRTDALYDGFMECQRLRNAVLSPVPALPDGVPCSHPGCLSHVSHPCEGCGRVAGHAPEALPAIPGLQFLLAEYVKALAKHPTFPAGTDGMGCTLAEEVLEVCTAGMRLLQAVNDHRDEGLPLADVRREFAHVWVVAGRAVGRLRA